MGKALGILLISDDRLSREQTRGLARGIQQLREQPDIYVEVLPGETTEEKLIERLEVSNKALKVDSAAQGVSLILVPWHKYLSWTRKLDGYLGLKRGSGPLVAGYVGDAVKWSELTEKKDFNRGVLLDLAQASPAEFLRVVRIAAHEPSRSGVLPLVRAGTPIYTETWMNGAPLGPRLDGLTRLAEITAPEAPWLKRLHAAQHIVTALWGFVYEEGPGKADGQRQGTTPRASFSVAADSTTWVFRLCIPWSGLSPTFLTETFWPNPQCPGARAQVLRQFADFLRINWVADKGLVEITAALYDSAPSEKQPQYVRTLWCEPITAQLIKEFPFAPPDADHPHLRPYPGSETNPLEARLATAEKQLASAVARLKELTQMIRERDDVIREMKMGGITTAAPLAPPDTEGLLESFQFRFFEADDELARLEATLVKTAPSDEAGIKRLQKQIQELTDKETRWIRAIGDVVGKFKARRAGSGK